MISRSSNVIASTLLSLGPKRVQKAADVCSSPQKTTIHTARTARKYQSPNYANMAYIFENYIPVQTFWCKIWIHTCTILGIGLIFTTVAPIFD